MPALSFSAVEILPALLSHEKCQTIRPAFCDLCRKNGIVNLWDDQKKRIHPQDHHEPRLKVGDICQLFWKQRTSPKDAWFCSKCGETAKEIGHLPATNHPISESARSVIACASCGTKASQLINSLTTKKFFPKQLGTVEITEVFTVTMKNDGFEFSVEKGDDESVWEELAVLDGFGKGWEEAMPKFAIWFSSHYGLSSPKKFHVYRFKWL